MQNAAVCCLNVLCVAFVDDLWKIYRIIKHLLCCLNCIHAVIREQEFLHERLRWVISTNHNEPRYIIISHIISTKTQADDYSASQTFDVVNRLQCYFQVPWGSRVHNLVRILLSRGRQVHEQIANVHRSDVEPTPSTVNNIRVEISTSSYFENNWADIGNFIDVASSQFDGRNDVRPTSMPRSDWRHSAKEGHSCQVEIPYVCSDIVEVLAVDGDAKSWWRINMSTCQHVSKVTRRHRHMYAVLKLS